MESKKENTLEKYTSDMLGAIRHIQAAIERHLEDEDLREIGPARVALEKTLAAIRLQHKTVEEHSKRYSSTVTSIKETITAFTGFLAGLYSEVRSDKPSKMLRDDCTALNFTITAYSMLCATALAFGDERLAKDCASFMKELAPLIVELSRAVPMAVISDLAEDGLTFDTDAVRETLHELTEAWNSKNLNQHVEVGTGIKGVDSSR
jgi:hypothetical protein